MLLSRVFVPDIWTICQQKQLWENECVKIKHQVVCDITYHELINFPLKERKYMYHVLNIDWNIPTCYGLIISEMSNSILNHTIEYTNIVNMLFIVHRLNIEYWFTTCDEGLLSLIIHDLWFLHELFIIFNVSL